MPANRTLVKITATVLTWIMDLIAIVSQASQAGNVKKISTNVKVILVYMEHALMVSTFTFAHVISVSME